MGVIESLPGGGERFHVIAGSGSFKNKLQSAIKSSRSLQPLSDNQEAIIKAVRKYENIIRMGKFGYTQRSAAFSQIKREANLDPGTGEIVKKILKHLSADVPISRVRINRADNQEFVDTHLANQSRPANPSGLSGLSFPDNARPVVQPLTSSAQSGQNLTGRPNSINRPPIIPLSR